MVSDIRQFKPIKPALGATSKFSEPGHGSMLVRVLLKTDRQISGIGVLHGVGKLLIQAHEPEENQENQPASFVHGHHQSFVGTLEPLTEVLPDRLLGGAGRGVLVQSQS